MSDRGTSLPQVRVPPMRTAPETLPEPRAAVRVPGSAASHRSPGRGGQPIGPWLALMVVLAVQASLSLRLVWSNTAFTDEALYLRSGHLELEHWMSGAQIPAFPAYFSGSPVIYPPLGALADIAGGLAAARILSLLFMLGATTLLWLTAGRLCGRRAGFFAAALFAVLGPTVRLGAFATFDAMALFLLALAAWCALRAAEQRRSAGWLAAAASVLALANAAKYATGLFDPVVFGILVLAAAEHGRWRHALARGATLACYTACIVVFLLALGGSEYLTGVEQTTLARASSTSTTAAVLGMSWRLTALVAVTAAVGALLAFGDRRGPARRWLLVLFAAAALLVPLQQARIHTLTSLTKHVDFGAWFAAVTAGYAVEMSIRLLRFRRVQWAATAVCALLLVPAAQYGLLQAEAIFRTWPDSTALVTALRRILPPSRGPILDDDNRAVPAYYLPQVGTQWWRWSNNSSLRLPDGKSLSVPVGESLGDEPFVSRVRSGYFSVLILGFSSAAALDDHLLRALQANRHYRLMTLVRYGGHKCQVWEYEPQRHFIGVQLRPPGLAAASPLGGVLTPAPKLRPILGTIARLVVSSGLVVLVLTALIRLAWRRGKASDEA